jgi:DNA repair photolyase
LQPYRGCPFGRSLCGAGCYVQHSGHLLKGRQWGSFLEVRPNAAEVYRQQYDRERNWARKVRGSFSIFLSSATEPFPPQEARFRITRSVLDAMTEQPPDELIVQTHSHRAVDELDKFSILQQKTNLRVHISIETDLDRLPGLPPHASSVEKRFEAARTLKHAGLFVVVTVSPLLPIADPDHFFARIAHSANAVVLDHFIGGDGSALGTRTLRTALPEAMRAVDPASVEHSYLDCMAAVAQKHLPGRVGIHIEGFAGRWTAPIAQNL